MNSPTDGHSNPHGDYDLGRAGNRTPGASYILSESHGLEHHISMKLITFTSPKALGIFYYNQALSLQKRDDYKLNNKLIKYFSI